jgi:ribonuclease R
MSKVPTKAQILDWIAANPGATSKRDIAKAFHVKGAARIDLKRMLKELEDEGHLEKRRKTYRDPDKLPPVACCRCWRPTIWRSVLQAAGMAWRGAGAARAVLTARHRSGDWARATGSLPGCRRSAAKIINTSHA